MLSWSGNVSSCCCRLVRLRFLIGCNKFWLNFFSVRWPKLPARRLLTDFELLLDDEILMMQTCVAEARLTVHNCVSKYRHKVKNRGRSIYSCSTSCSMKAASSAHNRLSYTVSQRHHSRRQHHHQNIHQRRRLHHHKFVSIYIIKTLFL